MVLDIYFVQTMFIQTRQTASDYTGSCNHIQTVIVKMSSSYWIPLTSEDRNLVIQGMESPDNT